MNEDLLLTDEEIMEKRIDYCKRLFPKLPPQDVPAKITNMERNLLQAQLDKVLKELKTDAIHISKTEGWQTLDKCTDWKHWGKLGYLAFIPEALPQKWDLPQKSTSCPKTT